METKDIEAPYIGSYRFSEDKPPKISIPIWLYQKAQKAMEWALCHMLLHETRRWFYMDQINFDTILVCLPLVETKEDFTLLMKTFNEDRAFNNIKEEIGDLVDEYANQVKNTYQQKLKKQREIAMHQNEEHWKEKQCVRIHLYRARMAGTPATLTLEEWLETLKRYNYTCAYCNKNQYEVLEHFVPISKGGGTTAPNCVPACRACNGKKSNKNPEQ